MIGKNTIEIDYRNFLRGISYSNDTSNGGFSPDSDAVNLIANPGILNCPAAPTDASTNLTQNLIASCDDPTYLGQNSLLLDDAGAFYTFDGTTLTKQVTASSDKFTRGTTDFVAWYDTTNGLNFYATTSAGSGGDIVKWNKSTTLTETWWTGAGTLNQAALSAVTSWRPLLVYEKYLFVGDKNKLHRISPDNPIVVSNGQLVLEANEVISALGIDKGSGYMMIAATRGVDASASRNSQSTIYLYDGFSDRVIRAIPVNGTITSFKQIDDRTIVFIGNKIGYFTGSGVKYLRTMSLSTGNSDRLVYPHHACVIDNTVYYIDGTKIMAYGEVVGGEKVFYPAFQNSPSGVDTNLDVVANIGSGKIGFGYASSKFYTFDTMSISSTLATSQVVEMVSNKYSFPRPVFIRQAYCEWFSAIADNSRAGRLYMIDEDGVTTEFSSMQNLSGSSIYNFTTNMMGKKVRSAQFVYRFYIDASISGLKRIVINYDVAE